MDIKVIRFRYGWKWIGFFAISRPERHGTERDGTGRNGTVVKTKRAAAYTVRSGTDYLQGLEWCPVPNGRFFG
jgi:hypothetical protein